ncbi:SLOG domain-containing protein [Photobacterium damselae]|uniref:SLOG domain-containing protein n=1 Tax=Photobacterium damselae TaxID=38293 RepID=UPI00370A1C05
MKEIFLSASIPKEESGDYFDTSDPYLIQCALRDFATITLGRRHIVFGGHPAITPLLWAVCEEIGVDFVNNVTLYQSKFFEGRYPIENTKFSNVIYIEAAPEGIYESLSKMRNAMLARENIESAVFIGGMAGIIDEFTLFKKYHPDANIIILSSPGGASRELANKIYKNNNNDDINFSKIFYEELNISPDDPRITQ